MNAENVITVSFAEDSAAYEAFTNLKELDEQNQVAVKDAAIVQRGEDGRLVTKDEVDDGHWTGTTTGGLIGLLIGILGGPFGVLIGGATGLLIGSLYDVADAAEEDSVLGAISSRILPGETVVVAEVSEQSDDVVDQAMAKLGGTVQRRSVADVEAEIAAAADALRAAKHEARKQLREERRTQLKDDIHAKVEELKAKQQALHAKQKEQLQALSAKL